MTSPLQHCRILVVEDEYAIAASLGDALQSVGATVVGPAPSVEIALRTIETEPRIDGAIVDINLGGAMADAVADRLLALNIPFIFTSGYEDAALRKRYPRITNCQKPYAFERIEEALLGAMSGASPRTKIA